jgi:hypothetical protein
MPTALPLHTLGAAARKTPHRYDPQNGEKSCINYRAFLGMLTEASSRQVIEVGRIGFGDVLRSLRKAEPGEEMPSESSSPAVPAMSS